MAPLIRQARIAAGMTQKALAEKTGCAQSAVSMFEAGKRDALAYDSIVKIAGLLKVELPDCGENRAPETLASYAFCPGFECPSNLAYMVGATVFLLPTGAAGNGKHCVVCGEAVCGLCHGCGNRLAGTGACCPECGAALVPFPHKEFTGSANEWVRLHNEVVEKLKITNYEL